MKNFLDDDFLLQTKTAEILYHDYASKLPIIDYHCHLSPQEIAEDKSFSNLTEIWLNGDHYKWRAMRTFGVDEQYITGDKDDFEKFEKWAATVPNTIRNPLFHWTHLELKNYFGIDSLLTPQTATQVYNNCSDQLQTSGYSTNALLKKMNVETVCTTDDPIDSLCFHRQVNAEHFSMFPAFRPDRVLGIENVNDFNGYIQKLSEASQTEINGLADLLEALQKRVDFFHEQGARLSDHGLEHIYAEDFTEKSVDATLKTALSSGQIEPSKALEYKSAILYHLGQMYYDKGWVQQFHLGALRNVSSRQLQSLGGDAGVDSIGDFDQARSLAKFLDRLDAGNKLAKTILYNLNPRDNEVMATMVGNFNDGSIRGKIQFGAAWWFLDTKDGMEKQLNALSNLGLLSCFVGMLTDSRSFLSFPRHEYFRRILCNLIGNDVENGELPNDSKWLGEIVSNICYHNAKQYFDF
ncbi:glucuronate isomerase [Fulvivirgaceae bacterium BMA12]|uniref:Uronate isomerase n=1 Tax=Agaribacillus aureus TaxID=3051825 RepID=A0ABT8LJA0_9BACT|nr:glucuronate isomerase [Fulvivirgaceae bacterium BMA12]